MVSSMSRRAFMGSAAAIVAAPAVCTRAAAAEEPLLVRCSLETVPSHARNAAIRDYLARIETSARGKIRTQLYESGQLFPDLQVGKALLQGQIEMAVPGSWVPDRHRTRCRFPSTADPLRPFDRIGASRR